MKSDRWDDIMKDERKRLANPRLMDEFVLRRLMEMNQAQQQGLQQAAPEAWTSVGGNNTFTTTIGSSPFANTTNSISGFQQSLMNRQMQSTSSGIFGGL